jgi:hypothetical protein
MDGAAARCQMLGRQSRVGLCGPSARWISRRRTGTAARRPPGMNGGNPEREEAQPGPGPVSNESATPAVSPATAATAATRRNIVPNGRSAGGKREQVHPHTETDPHGDSAIMPGCCRHRSARFQHDDLQAHYSAEPAPNARLAHLPRLASGSPGHDDPGYRQKGGQSHS